MTTPVPSGLDVISGCAVYLSAQTVLTDLLGKFESDDEPFLFQDEIRMVELEGTQKAAVVVADGGSWSSGNEHNTMEFPRLRIDLYVDPLRDADLNYVEPAETMRRGRLIWKVINSLLHRPQGGTQMWGGVRTLSCVKLARPEPYPVTDGDGMLRFMGFFAVAEG